jgi:hypothetical protein
MLVVVFDDCVDVLAQALRHVPALYVSAAV